MSRPSHILSVLQLFDGGDAAWTVEAIARELGVSVRTSYRTVAELTRHGFLDPGPGAAYVLGPAFIRFDRIIRQSDPLIRLASPGMLELLDEAGRPAAALLCRRFRDCVMCVHSVEAEATQPMASYERGVAMSPFRGAPAKIMLSYLPDRVLRGIYLRNEEAIRTSGIETWRQFRAMLRDVRKAGFAVTESEIGQNRMGIAAPILRGEQIVASLSLVVAPAVGEALQRLSALVTGVAASISSTLTADGERDSTATPETLPAHADAKPPAAAVQTRRRAG